MTHPTDLDQVLGDWLQEGAYSAPEAPIDEAIAHARRHPRRRDLFAVFRVAPMDGGANAAARRLAIWALLVLLALVAVGVAVAAGRLLGRDAFTVARPTASPAATADALHTPFMRPLEPGVSVPDQLIGSWYEATVPAFPWLLRAGDPYCVEVLNTAQDCTVEELADGSGRLAKDAIVTMLDQTVALKWIGGPCPGTSRYSYALVGDSLRLKWVAGSCISGDITFTRAGTNGTPTSPPRVAPP